MSEQIKLKSGKVLHPNMGIIGIDHECKTVSGGYDETIHGKYFSEVEKLTTDEKKELSEIMIERWKKFGNQN